MAPARKRLWSCSKHDQLQPRKLLKTFVTPEVKTLKSHFFTKVPSDPWNPQNVSRGKEPISLGCLSSLVVPSSHNDSCGSGPPTSLRGRDHLANQAQPTRHQATLVMVPGVPLRHVPGPMGHKSSRHSTGYLAGSCTKQFWSS